jgi:hypothetical protein
MASFAGQGTKSDGLPDSYEIQVNLDASARVHRAGLVLAMLQGKSHLLHPAVDAAGVGGCYVGQHLDGRRFLTGTRDFLTSSHTFIASTRKDPTQE